MDYAAAQDGFTKGSGYPIHLGFHFAYYKYFFFQEHSVHAQVGRDEPI